MKTKQPTPAQRRKVAEHRVATLQAEVEAKALERTATLLESPQPVQVPWAEYPAFDQWGMGGGAWDRPYLWSSLDDRTEGRYRPIYENDQDLRRMRADARRLQALFPIVEGAIEALTNYVIGTGFEFTVNADMPGAEQLAAQGQSIVDSFLDYNEFTGNLDREIHKQSRGDGECFPTLYLKDNRVVVELTQPDFILQPAAPKPLEQMLRCGHKLNYWWHGVHTSHCQILKRDDVTRPHGYHAVFDRAGDQWDYLPSSRVEHIKRNVGIDGRRGVSDLFIIMRDLELEAKIRRNTAEGAAILAAIVMIRQHAEGVTKSSIENMVQANSTASYEKGTQSGSRTAYVEQTRPGTIKDTPAGMTTTIGPMGTLRSPVYIEVAQYVLRIIGTRWNMPESLISSDASNANYASSLVAESPFVKAREHDQMHYAMHFESLVWKALRMYHDAGSFARGMDWQRVRAAISIKVDYSSPASRDKLQQAQVNELLSLNGIMSKRTWSTDMGLDYDEEQQEINGGTDDTAAGLETVQLNGLQVTAASEILQQVSAGETAEIVALGLLQSIGIPAGLARQMVRGAIANKGNAQAALAQKRAEKAANSPFAPKGNPFDAQARTESLAIRAMDLLMESANANT